MLALGAQNPDSLDGARVAEIAGDFLKHNAGSAIHMTILNGHTTVAGDVNVGGTRTRRSTGSTSKRESVGRDAYTAAYLSSYTDTYVKPDWFPEAQLGLLNRNLLVLSGQPGTGRDAAALALLVDVLRGGGPPRVTQLATDVLADPAWTVPDKGCGYVVLDQVVAPKRYRGAKPPVTADALDDVWLTRVSEQLRDAGSFLVVIAGAPGGRLAIAAKRHDFVLEQITAPHPKNIFDARLAKADLRLPLTRVNELLADTDVAELLAERPRPSFAVRVADAVVNAINSGRDLSDVLQELRDPAEQVSEWFGDTVDHAEIAFAVATAVLEECSYLTVSDAAGDLHRALAGKSAEPATHFRRTLRNDHTWIELARPDRRVAGRSPVDEVVRFRNRGLRFAVLTHAWHELDGMRPAIQEWLRGMAGHSDVEVRARAATAAGVLASGDFQHALHGFLLPWASSDSPSERQSAALALGVVGVRPEHTSRVWRLLGEFAAETLLAADRPLPATAAMAAGGLVGLADPGRALSLLRTLLSANDWGLLHPSALSVVRLIEDGAAVDTVPALREWIDLAERGDFTVKVLTAFVLAARVHALRRSASRWPVLLKESARHPDDLPELWARAISERRVRKLALEALRDWLRLADSDPTAYPVVLDVLAGIADLGDREARDLEHHLEVWALDRRDPSDAAANAHDDLADAEEALM